MTTRERKRRDNGDGTVYGPDKNGYFHARVVVGKKPNGEPDRRHVQATTRSEVVAKARELKRKRDAGKVTKPGRSLTVAQWMRSYLDDILEPLVAGGKRSPRTVDDYREKTRKWIVPLLGAHRLDQLRPDHIEKAHAEMHEAGLASATVLKVHAILRRALTLAERRDLISRNPAKLVEAPAATDVEITPFTEAEAKEILAAAERRRNAARWKIGFALGLRQGETLGLRWEYVDLDTGIVRAWYQVGRSAWRHGCSDANACGVVWHRAACPERCDQHRHGDDCAAGCKQRGHRCPTKTCNPKTCVAHASHCPDRHGGGVQFRLRKGRKKLTTAVPAELLPALKAHREIQDLERSMAGKKWQDLDLVFCRPDGTPIAREEDWAVFKEILREAGVPDRRLHDLRHCCATLLIAQHVPLRVVQEILGHSRSSVTERYTHVVAKQVADATSTLGKVLFG
ncbi:MAG TPA: tyrosine-type recombinase/integrase [Candidatus Limnocylindrales bacterium]